MSMVDIERLFDTRGMEGERGESPYAFVANKFMHVDSTREVVKEGQKIKEHYLDVEARTELNSPIPFASGQTYQVFLARRFKKHIPPWIQPDQDLFEIFFDRVQVAMINKDRKGRTEAKDILSAYFGGQRFGATENLGEQLLKK